MLGRNVRRISSQSGLEDVLSEPLEVLLAQCLVLVLAIIYFHDVSQDFEAAVSDAALEILILEHNKKHALDENIKVIGDELCANLFVHLVLLLVHLVILTPNFFGHDYPLNVLETLLDVLAALELLALHD